MQCNFLFEEVLGAVNAGSRPPPELARSREQDWSRECNMEREWPPAKHVAGMARPLVASVATPPVAELPVARPGTRHHHGEPPVQRAQVAYLVELGASGQTSWQSSGE